MSDLPGLSAAAAAESDFQSAEVWDKVTGRAIYSIDLRLPGMLAGKILRSPHPHARIKQIDSSGALAMPGVRAVLTGAGIRRKPFGAVAPDELILAVDTVRYIGDEVAAVAAVDEDTARRAVEAIRVEYQPLPAVFDPEAALQPGAPQLHGDFPGNLAWEQLLKRGDVERGFQEADTLRLKNCVRSGDRSVHGLKIENCNLTGCFTTAAAAIGWNNRRPGRGYGLSGAIHANGSIVAHKDFRGASALARLEDGGGVSVFTGEQDYGQGLHAALARIAARVLGISPREIIIYSKDTAVTPYSQGAFAMRQTTIGGNAVRLAAEDLKRKMCAVASEILGGEAEAAGGSFRAASGKTLSYGGIAYYWRCRYNGLPLSGEGNFDLPVSSCAQRVARPD